MTHDELLARVDDEGEFLVQYFDSKPKVHSALRAVVELHQQLDDNSCRDCVTWYPCDTIKAIEKELG